MFVVLSTSENKGGAEVTTARMGAEVEAATAGIGTIAELVIARTRGAD